MRRSEVKLSKGCLTGTLVDSSCDSFGTRTLTIAIYSDSVDQTVFIKETQDEGSWADPKLVIEMLLDEQIELEQKLETR